MTESAKKLDLYSGDQVEICLGDNPDHTKNRWVEGVVLGPSKTNSAEWYVDVNGTHYQTHWANIRPIPLCKPIRFTEKERTTIMWAIGKKHAQRAMKVGLPDADDPDTPVTDPELNHLHAILHKIRACRR
jgi:hypothetical protein